MSKKHLEDAHTLAARLDAEGRAAEASTIRQLILSNHDLARKSEDLQDRIDEATTIATETARCWEDRCRKIMAALGLDFGPTPDQMKELQLGQLEWAAQRYLQEMDRGDTDASAKWREEMRAVLDLAQQPKNRM